jgi:hypothetical protein
VFVRGLLYAAGVYMASDTTIIAAKMKAEAHKDKYNSAIDGTEPTMTAHGELGQDILELAPRFIEFPDAIPERGLSKDPSAKLKRDALEELFKGAEKYWEKLKNACS